MTTSAVARWIYIYIEHRAEVHSEVHIEPCQISMLKRVTASWVTQLMLLNTLRDIYISLIVL